MVVVGALTGRQRRSLLLLARVLARARVRHGIWGRLGRLGSLLARVGRRQT